MSVHYAQRPRIRIIAECEIQSCQDTQKLKGLQPLQLLLFRLLFLYFIGHSFLSKITQPPLFFVVQFVMAEFFTHWIKQQQDNQPYYIYPT